MAVGFDLIDESQLTAIIVGAVERVAKKVQKDILVAARRNVQKYYAQYDPDVYIRTDNLRNNVDHIPILIQSSSGNSISFEVGFQYDGSKIGAYADGGDPAMVFANFLDGVHPRTGKGREYYPRVDISQNQLMDEYVDQYLGKKIDGYMQSELIAALSRLM